MPCYELAMSIIVRDPDILSGTPCFQGTRVPVTAVFQNLAAGMTLDELLENFPSLNRADVLAVLLEAGDRIAEAA